MISTGNKAFIEQHSIKNDLFMQVIKMCINEYFNGYEDFSLDLL